MSHPPAKSLNISHYGNNSFSPLILCQYQFIGKDHNLATKTLHPTRPPLSRRYTSQVFFGRSTILRPSTRPGRQRKVVGECSAKPTPSEIDGLPEYRVDRRASGLVTGLLIGLVISLRCYWGCLLLNIEALREGFLSNSDLIQITAVNG